MNPAQGGSPISLIPYFVYFQVTAGRGMAFTACYDLVSILLFPDCRPSDKSPVTALSECRPSALSLHSTILCVYQFYHSQLCSLVLLTLALLLLCCFHIHIAVHNSLSLILIVLLQLLHWQRASSVEVSVELWASINTVD